MIGVDPISYIQLIFMHIGGRFLKFKVTPVQEKILDNKITQALIFYSLLLFSTKCFLKSFAIISLAYILLYVLMNEKSKYNIIPEKWLIDNNFKENKEYVSQKELYKSKQNELSSFR
jgi:hypothetical protein